jgi:hypothetical protein
MTNYFNQHSDLINLAIALLENNQDFPSTFRDEGYILEHIEPTIPLGEQEESNPDLTMRHHQEKSIVAIEAKTGAIKDEQIERYQQLKKEDIKNSRLTELRKIRSLDVPVFTSQENEEKITKSQKFTTSSLPLIVADEEEISSDDTFQDSKMEVLLQDGISFDVERLPQGYYPFDPDDPDSNIATHILPILGTLPKEGFSLDDILNKAHRHYDCMHQSYQEELKRRVGNLLSEWEEDFPEFIGDNLKETDDGYILVYDGSYRGWQSKSQEVVDTLREEEKQTRLSQF